MSDTIRIACIGDSVVYGWGISAYREELVWTAVLERLLNGEDESQAEEGHDESHHAPEPVPQDRRYEVRNFGMPGQSVLPGFFTPEGQIDTGLYAQMLEWKPDAVFLHIGINDTHRDYWDQERFAAGYRRLAEELTVLVGRRHVCLMECTYPLTEEGRVRMALAGLDSDKVVRFINPFIAQTAGELGTDLIDINAVFLSIPELEGRAQELYADEAHPNEAGNELIADAAYAIALGWEF